MSYLYKIPVIADNGLNYERRAVARLRAQGYRVHWNPRHKIGDVDAVIEPGVTVEIKGSKRRRVTRTADGFQFVIERRGYSAPIHERLVILLCAARYTRDDVLFILPPHVVRNLTTLTIPSNPRAYRGVYAVYRENFSLIDECLMELSQERENENE